MGNNLNVTEADILLAVDVQNDFCPGGALAVRRGDEVVAPINLLAQRFEHVALTQDWHPRGHYSFASSHEGRKPFETMEASYGPQTLWPDHCIQGTQGAQLHGDLHIPHAQLILRKGFHPRIDSYSAFVENDRKTPTGLAGYLRERGLTRIFLAGLALDYCVRYSAEDAQSLGFAAVIIEDACRAIDAAGSLEDARRSISGRNIRIAGTRDIL